MIIIFLTIGIFAIYLYKQQEKRQAQKQIRIEVSSLVGEDAIVPMENVNPIIDVKIKDGQVDTSKIIPYTGTEVKCFQWQPQSFSQYIGQEEAKEQAKTIIKKINRGIKCHVLLSAIQGHGKSLFVKLLARDLNAHYIERVGKTLDYDTIIDVINEINTCVEQKVIFFLDETDTADMKILKIMNPILQDFKLNNIKIKPFCFCGATINKDILISKVPDFLDRIQTQIQLHRYNDEEIKIILKQYVSHLYPEEKISENIYDLIAKSCKYNPRLSIGITEDYIVNQNLIKTFRDRQIIKDGLTDIDIKILSVLSLASKPLGANALSQKIGISQNIYTRQYEPYLSEFNYLERCPSRKITNKGRELLRSLENENLLL
jgi:Holliday junction resolvasome RuvABC ATP-dependent DNA helicase subunit